MGTSTSNYGQSGNTPLVPSWVDEIDFENPQPGIQPDSPDAPQQPNSDQDPPDTKRFTAPRSNFTRYINSGGRGGGSGSLRRAVSSYIQRSVGGSQNATRRLGSARSSTARLLSIVGGFANRGVAETTENFHLGDLIGRTAKDAFLRIMDFVCPDGGDTDEGIARSAFIEALVTMPDWENKQIEDLTPVEFLAFTEIYMANVIEERIINDIGNKIFALPNDVMQIDTLQQQMKEFIRGAVSDAVSQLNIEIINIDTSQAQHIVDSIYKKVFDIMSSLEG